MKQGLINEQGQPDLVTLLNTVKTVKEASRDYIGSTSQLFMHPDGSIEIDGGETLSPSFSATNHAKRQMTSWAKVPATYADRCPPELLANNLNHWFREGIDGKGAPTRMLRTIEPNETLGINEPVLRAFVSNKYRRIDNWDYANAVFPVLQEYADKGLVIASCNVGEHSLHLKGYIEGIEETIVKPGAEMGKGHDTYYRVRPGFEMRNGETGKSSVTFANALLDTGCTNLAIFRENQQRRMHVGAAQAEGELWSMLSDETQAVSNQALMMQLADYARSSLDASGEAFKTTCDLLREKVGIEVKRPEATFKLVADQWQLSEAETNGCIAALLTRGDMSVFGVQAAITQYSQEDAVEYERASELEAIGGSVLAFPAQDWNKLLTEADTLKVRVAA